MKHYLFPIAILLLLLSACNDKRTDEWEDKTYHLKGEKMALNHFFYVPRDLCLKDSLLFIQDYGSDTIFYAYNMNKRQPELIYSYGTKGDGPDEYIFPTPLRIREDRLCFYDRALYKYQMINPSTKEVYSEKISPVGFYNIVKIKDSVYVGDGFFSDGRFKLLQKDSCADLSISYPDDNINCSFIQKAMVYQGDIIAQPHGTRFVYSAAYGGIIEIYQVMGDNINLLYTKNYHFPQYTPYDHSQNEVSANLKKENIKSNLSIYATDNRIYLLYSGKTLSDPDHNYSNTIYVWDWDGKEIGKYIVDHNLSAICIDSNDQSLYGLYYNTDNEFEGLVKFELSRE